MNPATSCPDTQKLQQFVLGRVSPEELDRLAAHVEHCRRCIATLHALTVQNPFGEVGPMPSMPITQADADNLLDLLKKRLQKPAIAVRCPQCGKDLKVKEELAGKKVRCPQCKQVLDVPAPEGATLAPRGPAVAPIAAPHIHDAEADIPADSEETEIVKGGFCYEVSSEIARGGMGAIMRAVDQDIHREVAVKFLLNHADAHQKARFVEEAQITGQLEHPNIVPIHQLGAHKDGRCFFSMKMVKGRSLAEILKQQGEEAPSPLPLSPEGERGKLSTPLAPRGRGVGGEGDRVTLGQFLTIFAGVCNGMAYAHSRQVIHRDLKPANIMVGDFGEVYVMDWGLAKVLGSAEAVSDRWSAIKNAPTFSRDPKGIASDSKTDSKVTTNRSSTGELTQAGSIMGTPAYMSPEQAQGDPDRIDERTDIYALGAIMSLSLEPFKDLVTDLTPLQGMKLSSLDLKSCSKVRDLAPLEGMKLTRLDLGGAQVSDLTPLQGMELMYLDIALAPVRTLAPLRGMKLTVLSLGGCREIGDLSPLKDMPLTNLNLHGAVKIRDLTPLKGMPLTSLFLAYCEVSDLSPLKGMPLTSLSLGPCGEVSDLSPLKGMPLTTLFLIGCPQVRDLSPLKGMKLVGSQISLWGCEIQDLSPLTGMALNALDLRGCPVKDLGPLRGMPLNLLDLQGCKALSDLTPLEGMKLEAITLPPTVTKGLEVVRNMSSLKTIDSKPAAQFWKEHDAKKTGK